MLILRIFQISDPTVGVDFFASMMEVKDGTRIKLQLWDTAGQGKFFMSLKVPKSYYNPFVDHFRAIPINHKIILQ